MDELTAGMSLITPWRYEFAAGPQPVGELGHPVTEGNCRRLVQRHLWSSRQIAVPPDAVLNPQLFHSTGTVVRRGRPINLAGLRGRWRRDRTTPARLVRP